MDIRAHHLLCLFGFSGTGYGEAFDKAFKKTRSTYQNEPLAEIQLVTKPDDICTQCIFYKDNACNSQEDGPEELVRQLDRKILSVLGINEGFYRVKDMHITLAKLSLRQLESLCEECPRSKTLGCPQTIYKAVARYREDE